jgi:hypothetical protein
LDSCRRNVVRGDDPFTAGLDASRAGSALEVPVVNRVPVPAGREPPRVRPWTLSELLDAVVEGLRRLPETRPPKLPRMADFALWATACDVDVLDDIVKAAVAVPLRFQLQISLGDGEDIGSAKVEEVNKLLESVSPDLRVKA